MKLYEIPVQIEAALNLLQVDPETGEIIGGTEAAKAFADIELEAHEKISATIAFIRNLRADKSAVKSELDRLSKVEKALENKEKNVLGLLLPALDAFDGKFKDATGSASVRRSSAVEIENLDDIPKDFIKIKREPEKALILKALKDGQNVPGATLISRESITIR